MVMKSIQSKNFPDLNIKETVIENAKYPKMKSFVMKVHFLVPKNEHKNLFS